MKQAHSKYVGKFHFEFNDDGGAGGSVALPTEIHLIPIGQWQHDLYGPITITASDIREFVQNFNANIRKGIFITAGHEGFEELPAVAWITKVMARDDGLWGVPEWNDLGKVALGDKQYKYFSPEFYRDYEDPETHEIYRNVLTGGALTKSPYFKELEALVASEKVLCFSDKNLKSSFTESTMNLTELLAKDKATLTAEEKAFINDHKAELTAEQVTELGDVITAPTETDEEKTAREAKELGDANEAKGLNRDGSEKTAPVTAPTAEEIQASEKVTISAVELAHLRGAADKGVSAFNELRSRDLSDATGALMFSSTNKAGKFLPKDKDAVRSFMETLSPAQRTQFSSLVKAIPDSAKFSETGSGTGAGEGTAGVEVEAKVTAKMKANDKLGYSEALREVFAENEGLETRYDSELTPVGKVNA